jgi:putative YhdH/YhfP family quinone oxidoreductase
LFIFPDLILKLKYKEELHNIEGRKSTCALTNDYLDKRIGFFYFLSDIWISRFINIILILYFYKFGAYMNKAIKFKALEIIEKKGKFFREIIEKKIGDLPDGEVLIRVKYSSLNYKDALSASGNRGVTRRYPHTPGIDAAGIVEESSNIEFKPGGEVIIMRYDLGMNTPGGFGQFISVPSEWIIKVPAGISLKESMVFGTAGFTAGFALDKLEAAGLTQNNGELLVTGATGGVGTLAVAIGAKAGFNITAATGKPGKIDYLNSLGANKILKREEVDDKSGRALLPVRWAGVIDTVGGNILSTAIKSTKHNCSVVACGLTQSPELNLTAYPFILRGVNLLGVKFTPELRTKIWNKLASTWKPGCLDKIYSECRLEELNEKFDLILDGKITGRIVVNLE